MLKIGDKGKEVNERRKRSHAYRELQEKLLGLGYELPKYANPNRRLRLTAKSNRRLRLTGADGGYGRETESAVSEFKQELIDLAGEEGVSTELQS